MTLTLGSPQCFAIGMIIFGFWGWLQGWRRLLVLMGFTLAAVLFLSLGSANGIASFIFVRLPETINTFTGGALFSSSMPPPSAQQVLISALIALGLAMFLGINIGHRAFPPPGTSIFGHFVGIIPGLVTGYAVISYLSRLFVASPTISLGVTTPSPTSLGTYILVLVIIGVVALIIGWLTKTFGGP